MSAQNIENDIIVDTLFIRPKFKITSNLKSILSNFPNLCCNEESNDRFIKTNPFDVTPILQEFELIDNYEAYRINSIVVAGLCNNCNEVSSQVTLFEFVLTSEEYAEKLCSKINRSYRKKGYAPFGKNWFWNRVKNKVYFIQAFSEDSLNTVKVELINRIKGLDN